jgi:hypothetical protein
MMVVMCAHTTTDGSETATLLRSNNMATIMLIEFCRMFGMGYLSSTLKSLVTRVCQHPGTIEVTTSRHSPPFVVVFVFVFVFVFVILIKLIIIFSQRFESIVPTRGRRSIRSSCWTRTIGPRTSRSSASPPTNSSPPFSPPSTHYPTNSGACGGVRACVRVRWCVRCNSCHSSSSHFHANFARVVWQHLHKKVKQYFPDSALKLVGGFLFLRFFCPAILAPHNFGLVDEPPCPEAQRHLTLVTKTLQNLANGMRFGTKEPYMGTHTHTHPLS